MAIQRAPWPTDFPDVIVHTSVAARDGHPDYAEGKAGVRHAAARLANALLSDAAVARIQELLARRDRRPVVVPVRAIEAAGINLIPDAMAHELGQRLGLAVTSEIIQTNTVGHTRATGFHRLAFQPTFAGSVAPRDLHILVDDHVGLGGTLANLRGHIEAAGGHVVLATTLSASRRSEVLALRAKTRQDLWEKHGEPLERYWQETFGFGLDLLTEAEAGYLLRTPSVDTIRDRMVEARGAGVPGGV